jgi:polysaccharide biosynthesis protein PslG
MRRAIGPTLVGLALLISVWVVPSQAEARGFFGVVAAETPTPQDLDGMANARVGSLRINFTWSDIQPTAGGPLDFSQIDPVVAGTAARGIDLLPVLYSSPAWAVDCSQAPTRGCETISPLSSTRGADAWRAFVLALVRRYGPGGTFWSDTTDAFNPPYRPIRRWQIWNEVNSPEFFQPKPSPSAYARLLTASADEIRSVNPGAKVYLAGLFGTPPKPGLSSRRFLNGLYRIKGIKSDFDVVAVHPYSPGVKGMIFQLQFAREAMIKHGDRRTPLAVTEIGWSSGPRGGGILFRGPAGQSKALRAAFAELRRDRRRYKIESAYWFSWRDLPVGVAGPCSFCGTAGLLRNDYTAKPSLGAFTDFTGGRP